MTISEEKHENVRCFPHHTRTRRLPLINMNVCIFFIINIIIVIPEKGGLGTHRCSVPHHEPLHQHHPAGGHRLLPRHLLTPAARHEASMMRRRVRFSRCFQDASVRGPGEAERNLRRPRAILHPVPSTETSRHLSAKVHGASGPPSSDTEVLQCFLFSGL